MVAFMQLVNHGLPVELLERVKKVCSECYKHRAKAFKASKPVQMLNELVKEEGKVDGEAQQLDNADWEDVFVLQDDNQWPSNPPEFKEMMREYRQALQKLAEQVIEIRDHNLGLQAGTIKNAFTGNGELGPFFGTKNDQVGGLQILKDGCWLDVQPLANAIVINTGDQIEVLSNGRYKSIWHRVLATSNSNCRSIASFYNPVLKGSALYPKYAFGAVPLSRRQRLADTSEQRGELDLGV